MSKLHGRRHHDRGLKDMAAPLPEPWAPDRRGSHPEPSDVIDLALPDPLGYSDILRVQRWWRDGRLIDFVFIQSVDSYDEEADEEDSMRVAVIYFCHGKGLHVHHYRPAGSEVSERPIRPVAGPDEVEAAYDVAENVAYRDWEKNRRDFNRLW